LTYQCTLSENFISRHESLDDLLKTLKVSYLYAKTVTLVKTHWSTTNAVMGMNRRIGLGMTGVVQACDRHGYRTTMQWLDQAYDYVTLLDQIYSDWLTVPRSKKRTTVKPSGTTSKLPGVTPGAHWAESEYYIQRMRFSHNSELLPAIIEAGYHTEPSVTAPDTTVVVEFPVKEKYFTKGKDQVSMWEQLELAAQLQENWSDNGVSITVTFHDHEADQVKDALTMYESRLKSVSFLRYSNTGYQQAPWEAITKEAYDHMISKIKPLQFGILTEDAKGEKYCSNDSCEIDFS
jgi:ribonucleoside-triphosphate reductase